MDTPISPCCGHAAVSDEIERQIDEAAAGGRIVMRDTAQTARKQRAINYARWSYADPSHDDIEIDDTPVTSPGDDGIWVQAWVWVPNDEIDE